MAIDEQDLCLELFLDWLAASHDSRFRPEQRPFDGLTARCTDGQRTLAVEVRPLLAAPEYEVWEAYRRKLEGEIAPTCRARSPSGCRPGPTSRARAMRWKTSASASARRLWLYSRASAAACVCRCRFAYARPMTKGDSCRWWAASAATGRA